MARHKLMATLARWHIWLGWLVGVPILLWTVSGLVMVARPIEQVRGEDLRRALPPLAEGAITLPQVGEPIREARLVQQVQGPVWIVTTAKGATYRYSARNGALYPPLVAGEARTVATGTYAGPGKLLGVTYLDASAAPLELRANRATWQARFSDGTNLYLDDATGEVLALRTPGWRLYDFMWGLHIMDLQTREDSSHPVLILFATLSALGALIGCLLLFRHRKARVRAQ